MKWLKYQHKHSSGRSAWQWKPLHEDGSTIDDDYVRSEILPDIVEEFSYSDKYSGVDYEIVDRAPQWVIERHIRDLGDRVTAASTALREFTYLLANGGVEDCKQCDGATVATREHYREYGTGTTIKPCPSCGREILYATLKYILMPDDTDAIKLLGSLVERGERSVKSKKFRWPVEDKDEEDAFDRLVKLGLAGGSSYQDKREIHATESGKAEWLKHKGAAS